MRLRFIYHGHKSICHSGAEPVHRRQKRTLKQQNLNNYSKQGYGKMSQQEAIQQERVCAVSVPAQRPPAADI